MKNRITTICAILTSIIGWNQRSREGFIIGIDDQGLPFYPMSSGSNDGFILAVGFMSLIITALYSLGAYSLKWNPERLNVVYWLNLFFLASCVFLVELDSSIIQSALYGDIVPFIGLATAFFPGLVITLMYLVSRKLKK
jgi:hypothetical protein